MRKLLFFTFACILQVMILVSATSRHFAPNHVIPQGQSPISAMEREMFNEEAIGSRPPNCNHKCGGCFPCEAIQVPTRNDRVKVQYANYEPEGWKCKCGASIFSP
ncbi:hypothetical protein ACHQM5_001778 [Ranunculus cassubicifolius]